MSTDKVNKLQAVCIAPAPFAKLGSGEIALQMPTGEIRYLHQLQPTEGMSVEQLRAQLYGSREGDDVKLAQLLGNEDSE